MRGRTVAALALVVAAACGGDDEAASPTTDTTAVTATTPTTAATTTATAAADAGACGIAGAEDVEIDSGRGDGTTIHGVLAGEGTTAVVLAHESGQDACDWASYVPDLVDAGHAVLAVDLNTVGDRRLDLDVAAGVAEVRARGAERVVAIGASMGGTAAVAAAGAPGTGAAIDGVVSISAPASYLEADALAAAPAVAVPVLFVAAEDDGDAAADARAMADAATASPSAEVVVVPGGRHGTRLLPDTADESAEVRGAIDALLASVQDGG